ncbi:hypothetical protein RN607_03585 [Demequina capsici]|uniref:Putative Flp pilus-assembly TadG-like N-terminal domain-containing protein n=1 Tax=Demequina capsici TaxID=3075620 RepID=A0AA96JE16_9MICO|nr:MULTISPECIES: pilus assembly protein TadG-related protein [unclassified Demequina]WNM25184.1 hypothetical protein RN606_03280 [Demequina sp. OYTSA14]WNM28097.1 hypothetical protein RN607_03585 [Demequina sp. PMTSA13]
MRRRAPRHRDRGRADFSDSGNVTVLTLGVVAVLLAVVLVVASSTAVQLQRVRLLHLADELALDAADSADVGAYFAGDSGAPDVAGVALATARMTTAVDDHLAAASERHGVQGAAVADVTTPDGSTAVVEVELRVHPLFDLSALAPFADGIVLRAESSARAS